MDYILPVLLVLLAVVNTNLVRVALKTGLIQSRFMRIHRSESIVGFWSALALQILISLLCLAAAAYRLSLLL